jgi:hypothetical protein
MITIVTTILADKIVEALICDKCGECIHIGNVQIAVCTKCLSVLPNVIGIHYDSDMKLRWYMSCVKLKES